MIIQYFRIVASLVLTTIVGSTSNLMSTPLVDGVEFRQNLLQGEVACRSIAVPPFATSVLIEASVVGLTGNPNIFGGWEESEISAAVSGNLAPTNSGGYHILSEFHQVPVSRSSYYICVTTFSTQGCDYALTVSISDALNWSVSPLRLLDGYPVVWRLGGKDYVDFQLETTPGADLRISLTPFFGEVDLKIGSDCFFSTVLAVAESEGPEFIEIPSSALLTASVCIRVHTREIQSDFTLVASSAAEGPLLAQSVPLTWPSSAPLRTYFHQNVDLTVEVSPTVSFKADTIFGGDAWSSHEGKLEISKSALSGRSGNLVYFTLASSDAALLRVVVTSHSSVEQLSVGVPLEVVVEGENRFRDLRVWVPAGVKFFSVSADSSKDGSGLGLFASQTRTSHDPRGYSWNTMVGTNELIWTVGENIENFPNTLSSCLEGCYLYLSIKSCTVDQGQCNVSGATSTFMLLASADIGVTQLPLGRELSLVLSANTPKVLEVIVSEEKGSSRLIQIGGPVTFWLSSSSTVDSEIPNSPSVCEGPSRCTIVVDSEHPLFESDHFFVHLLSSANAVVSAAFRMDSTAQYLKNHHSIYGQLGAYKIDRFMFVLPPGAENGLISFDSTELSVRACKFGQAGCQSITGSGTIHMNATVAIEVRNELSNSIDYRLTGSFFSAANSLRIGYKPVQVSVKAGSKITWQVGYYEHQEWLITVDSAVTMCVETRCCEGPCTLQGFGRELVWLENRGKSESILATISTENLPVLVENVKVNISGRKSQVFAIPANSKVITDGSVAYSESQATISANASWAKLLRRHDLFLNKWNENSEWNFVGKISEQFLVRIEQCDDSPVTSDVMGPVAGVLDYPASSLQEFHVEGKFRVALVSGEKIESVFFNNIVGFIAPENAAGTLYTLLCSASASSACMMEHDPHAIRSAPFACGAFSLCEVAVPPECTGSLVVVPERGPEFGLFNVLNASSGASPSGAFAWWSILLRWLGVVAILILAKKYLVDTNIVRKFFIFLRGNSSKKSVYEELRSMERGGEYMRLGGTTVRERNSRTGGELRSL